MKFKTYFFSSFIVLILISYAFNEDEKSPIEIVTKNYVERFKNFKTSINDFNLKVKNTTFNKANLKSIKSDYFKLRSAFKKWEYIAEYMDPIFIKDNINGAPLQKLEQNSFGANIIEPRGLQAIDEFLFSNEATTLKENILLALSQMTQVLNDHALIKIYDRDVFIASRQGLVRLYALGVTGFDTPGSLNGLEDTKIVITSISEDMSLYLDLLKDRTLADSTKRLFEKTINYLNLNTKFETFDRLIFLTDFINPLYKNIYQIHVALSYEMPNEISLAPNPINYDAKNIFDRNFLKSSYYNQVPSVFATNETIELGKTLFFDPLLSKNNERSCASCHNPQKGFTDQLPTSAVYGHNGFLKRNSPTLINSVFSEKYFHDLRAKSFEDQTDHVITNPDEFNSSFSEVLEKINESKQYRLLFKNTFKYNDTAVSLKYMQFALSAYVSSLVGLNSEFDKYVRGESKTISKSVKNGYNLFMGKAACGTCHYAPVFNGTVPPYYKESESEVLGVPQNPYSKKLVLDTDQGRGNSLLKERVEFYKYSFKTPTVRNSEISFPYMHNGSYKTLEDVMDFYNKGGGKGLKLNVPTQTLGDDKLNLSKKEISDIISFMKSLTDTTNLTAKPRNLPTFENNEILNSRVIGGVY